MQRSIILLLATDALAAALVLILGHGLRFLGFAGVGELFAGGGVKVALFATCVVFAAYFCELYGRERQVDRLELAARLAVSLSLAFLLLSAVYYVFPDMMIGRGVLSLSLIACGVVQYLVHRAFLAMTGLPGFAQRVLILGIGPLARTIEATIPMSRNNYQFAGFVRPGADLMTVPPQKIVGHQDEIEAVIKRERASKLVVAVTERRGVLPVRDLLRCKLAGGVEVVDSVSFYEQMTGKLLIENIQPSWFIYSSGFRVTPFMRAYKRMFDILLSSLGIILALPFWPLVALAVKLDSPGPALFKQVRVGERNRHFNVLKFRTMCNDAEKHTGAKWATENDPRITRVGGFLRKSRLDEIPQLFNVLRGDMSFVGPRPERPEFVERLSEKIPYYAKRHYMKPGVTGWAQVCYPYGASDKDSLEKLRYDLYYIKNYSLMLDFLIILETVKVVLYGRGGR
ncbi:TIGR03013 family XrtA/PEP-CTERM system glycosyltransferase [Desulfuromonas versatilis]